MTTKNEKVKMKKMDMGKCKTKMNNNKFRDGEF